jgi:hypothetical protein
MKRRILMVLFALGAIGGFGSGFCRAHHRMAARHAAFEAHVAQVCVDAARGEGAKGAAP